MSRRPTAAARGLAVALLLGGVISGCGTSTPERADEDARLDCGRPVLKPDGSAWTCEFADDFDGDALDTTHWTVLSSLASGYRNGPECYLGDESPLGADDVTVAGGALHLTAKALDHEVVCPSLSGDFPSRWTGAFVTTYGKYTTTFGRVEVRAAFPDVDVPGVHAALWLWPQDLAYGSEATGEIDLAEYFSLYPDRAVPFLHYQPAVPDGSNTNNLCLLDDPSSMHSYVIEWEPGHVRIAYDGEVCVDHDIVPSPPLTGSQPFDQPFTLNLTQALGVGSNAFGEQTPLPATTTVDYVRVWS
ncbi:glycoside hydrolase family 16 protein [Nocardioides halotolerans]|uniref:glycoside hydrolase family 16 protein n=1 Tax=Nocardioides halotolerans TaxID=433660 RepID=UPI00049126A9|nr:glycoside hydrolase family 16 protein [Nocardioides halotolerans]